MPRHILPSLLFAGFLVPAVSSTAAPEIRQVLDPSSAGKGDTLVWTALTARSWQDLAAAAGVTAIDLRWADGSRTPSPVGEALNASVNQLDHVLPPTAKTWSGEPTADFLHRINQELATLFPGKTRRVSAPGNLPPHSLMAVTALDHRVEFSRAFYRARGRTLRFVTSSGDVKPVAFFGTQGAFNDAYSEWHVRVHAYTTRADFVVELGTRTEGESLWIVRTPGQSTLQAHFDTVKKAVAATPPADAALTPLDVLQIPCLDFSSTADLTKDLSGSFAGTAGNKEVPYRIAGCHQWIDFQLDEAGARIKATADLAAAPFGSPPPPPKPKPRQLICDGPFSVLLWRKAALIPYAAFHMDGGNWN